MLLNLVRKSRHGRGVRMRAQRRIPFVPLLLYYGVLLAVGYALVRWLPGARDAIMAPIVPAAGTDFLGSIPSALPPTDAPWSGPFGRFALAMFTVVGAILMALPVAGVYMHTRRLRYDPSLVQTMIILPIVVAGVVLVVKNSLALAFALAGIVAGVRFRQKLNEPKDAVYVLLSLGLGLAAAVQALDVALAISLVFNATVLALWRYDPRTHAGATLNVGDVQLLAQDPPLDIARIRTAAPDMETDGVLVVHAPEPDAARQALEFALNGEAKEWQIGEPAQTPTGLYRIEVLVRLSGKGDPVDLLSEIEDRWSAQVAVAEYTPLRRRKPQDEEEDDDD
jgi:hypothetical protein